MINFEKDPYNFDPYNFDVETESLQGADPPLYPDLCGNKMDPNSKNGASL